MAATARETENPVKPPTSVFALGRMRHLDLLALWFLMNPRGRGCSAEDLAAAQMPKDALAALIRNSAPHP